MGKMIATFILQFDPEEMELEEGDLEERFGGDWKEALWWLVERDGLDGVVGRWTLAGVKEGG